MSTPLLNTSMMIALATQFPTETKHVYETRLGILIGAAAAAAHPEAVKIAYDEAKEYQWKHEKPVRHDKERCK